MHGSPKCVHDTIHLDISKCDTCLARRVDELFRYAQFVGRTNVNRFAGDEGLRSRAHSYKTNALMMGLCCEAFTLEARLPYFDFPPHSPIEIAAGTCWPRHTP